MHTNFNEHIQAYTLGFIVIANAPRHTNTHLHQVMTQFVGVMLVLDRFQLQRLVVMIGRTKPLFSANIVHLVNVSVVCIIT